MADPAMLHFRCAQDLRDIPVGYMPHQEAEQVLGLNRLGKTVFDYKPPFLVIYDYPNDGETRVYVERKWVASMLPYLRKGE